MGTQHLSLKRSNVLTDMLNSFKYLLSNQSLVDVTLACEGRSLKVHKLILAAYSPFFQSLFSENPCKHPIVFMKNVKYADLETIVDFMYRGEVSVPQHQLASVVKTAQELQVQGLEEVRSDERQIVTEVNMAEVDMTNPPNNLSIEHVGSVNVSSLKDGKGTQDITELKNFRNEKHHNESELVLSEFPAFIEEVKIEIESSDDEYETNDADDYIPPQVSSVYSEYHDSSMQEIDSECPSTSVQNVSANMDELTASDSQMYEDGIAQTSAGNNIQVQGIDSVSQKITTRSTSRPKRKNKNNYDSKNFPMCTSTPEYGTAKDAKSFAIASHKELSTFTIPDECTEEDCAVADQSDVPEPSVTIVPPSSCSSDILVNEGEVQETICVEPDIFIPSGDESGFSHSNASYHSLYADIDQNVIPDEELVQEQSAVGQYLAQHASRYLKSNTLEKKSYVENGNRNSVETQSKHLSYWENQMRQASSISSVNGKGKTKATHISFTCDICDKEFPYNFALKLHQRTHARDKLFKCNYCNKKYMQKELLEAHYQTHSLISPNGEKTLNNEIENIFNKEPIVQLHRIKGIQTKHNVCNICNKRCNNSYNLKRHQMAHTGQKPFPCGFCRKRFYRMDNLLKHKKSHQTKSFITHERNESTDEKMTFNKQAELKVDKKEAQVTTTLYHCNVCNKIFGNNSHLIKHKLTHACKKTFNCNACNRKFLNEYSLRLHQFSHKKDLTKKALQKTTIGKRYIFSRRMYSTSEMKTEDANSQFSCNICVKTFQNCSQLIRHARFHSVERPFSCDICSKRFKRKDHLKTHQRVHDQQIIIQNKKKRKHGNTFTKVLSHSSSNQIGIIAKLFRCENCDKKFQSNSELIAHQKIHNDSEACSTIEDQKPYICTRCGDMFPEENLLETHSQNCKRKELQSCEICGKSFANTADLLCHLERHAGRLPFTCGLCGKSFAYKHSFAKHCKTHEKGKYICNRCGEEFLYAAQLLVHVRMHASEKRFSCTICHKKFGLVFHLNRHLDRHKEKSADEANANVGDTHIDHTYAFDEIDSSDQIRDKPCSNVSETLKDE